LTVIRGSENLCVATLQRRLPARRRFGGLFPLLGSPAGLRDFHALSDITAQA
jgi:hypothetical protein